MKPLVVPTSTLALRGHNSRNVDNADVWGQREEAPTGDAPAFVLFSRFRTAKTYSARFTYEGKNVWDLFSVTWSFFYLLYPMHVAITTAKLITQNLIPVKTDR